MTNEQEEHLSQIKEAFEIDVDMKYRKGQREHGGDLMTKTPLELVDMAIDEAIDQFVYLTTLRSNLLNKK